MRKMSAVSMLLLLGVGMLGCNARKAGWEHSARKHEHNCWCVGYHHQQFHRRADGYCNRAGRLS